MNLQGYTPAYEQFWFDQQNDQYWETDETILEEEQDR